MLERKYLIWLLLLFGVSACHTGGKETGGLTPIDSFSLARERHSLASCSFSTIEDELLHGETPHAGHIQKTELPDIGQVRLAYFYQDFKFWEVRFVKASNDETRVDINAAMMLIRPDPMALDLAPLIRSCGLGGAKGHSEGAAKTPR